MSAMLFIALFASSLPAHSAAPVITSVEYMPEAESSSYGTIVATPVPGTSNWILEAVPADDTKWRFKKWSDDNTDNPRTVTFTDLSADFTVVFTRFIYTNCYSDKEYMTVVDNPAAPNNYGYIDTNTVDGVLYAEAIANPGYTFAQWADGSYVNPRPFQNDGSSTSTLYATFIPTATKGKIDSWDADGFYVTTTYSEGAIDEGYMTLFVDGQPALCGAANSSSVEEEIEPGVYYFYAGYDPAWAGKKLHMVYKDGSYVPTATLDAVVPVLVQSDETVLVPNSETGVHVFGGATATFSDDQEIAELEVYPEGKAVIESNVTASSVALHGDAVSWSVPANLLVTGTLTNTNSNIIYYDCALDYNYFYPFSLPYTVSTSDVTYRSGNDAADHFVLGDYSGEARAAGNSGWDYTRPYYDHVGDLGEGIKSTGHVDINTGVGYYIYGEGDYWGGSQQEFYGNMIRFPMTVDLSSGGETSKSVAVQMHDGEKYYRNWNLISLPYMTSYQGELWLCKGSTKVRQVKYVTKIDYYIGDYTPEQVDRTSLNPFQAFFVQFDNDIDVDNVTFESPNPAARATAPAKFRAPAKTSIDDVQAGITLAHAGKSDHTGLYIGKEYTTDYDVDADLAKMLGSSTQRIKLFSLAGSKKLAYMALPPANGNGVLETVVPLGYTNATVNKELTFAIDKKRFPEMLENEDLIALELVDNVTGETTDLLSADYTCTAYQKADNSRFALNVRYKAKAPQIITEVDESTIRATSLPDGVYDLLGRRINTQNLPAGAYIVIENGQTRKEVIR